MVRIPGFSQGRPEPPDKTRHAYGGMDTIHQTGTIDIQVSPEGEIVRVWFRCLSLPFTVGRVHDSSGYNPVGTVAVESVTVVDRTSPSLDEGD